jgi:hypothetical protein
MSYCSHNIIENISFPKTVHRINIIQIGISLSTFPSYGLPSKLSVSPPYIDKLKKALKIALQDNWSNIVVFPEISIPAQSLQELMTLSWDIMRSRSPKAEGCLVCLPIEHLSLVQFQELINKLNCHEHFIPGDISINNGNVSGYLLEEIPPSERSSAFVNVAVLLAIGKSGENEKGRYFFQPKRFPYLLERTSSSGKFVPGAFTYVLEISGIRFMTSICFDLIAQPPGKGLFLSRIIQECCEKYGNIDYLLVPQCNDKPLDNNFQRAVVDIYHHFQVESQRMRLVSPNVAHIVIVMQNSLIKAGHSWFVTCPFGSELPPLGIWEKNLVSVTKDPSTQEIVRDAPSIGHYAQRLRLAAEGEWILNLSLPTTEHLAMNRGPNVPLPPHTGKVYGFNCSEWQEREGKLFERDCRLAERLPGLLVLTELAEWVQENIGGRNTYSPSYDEFNANKVYLPENDRTSVLSLLNSDRDVWLKGEPACGKTVFGLSIAFDWMSDRNGRCLIFDLKDLELDEMQFVEKSKGDIDWFFQTIYTPLLVVLDNVHTNNAIAQKLLMHIQDKRDSGHQIQAMLLGRYSPKQPTERLTLLDNKYLESFELKATEESFLCVARRLSQKSGITLKPKASQTHKWLRECGNDLVIFATVFKPTNPEELDKASISEMVRLRYLIPAEKQGGRDAFLDLCVLNCLDINLEDSSIWRQNVETLFPQFVDNGTVLRTPMKPRNPRSYCRLFHPSLGELILRVVKHFSANEVKKMWISRALDLCHHHPFLLSLIHHRLESRNYDNIINFNQWCEIVNNEDGLIEYAVCHSPIYTVLNLRTGYLSFSWNRLQKLTPSEGYDLLLENLLLSPPHFSVIFLRYLDERNLKKESENLLGALIQNEVFKERLARTSADISVVFLRYLDERNLKKESENLLGALIQKVESKEQLAWTFTGRVVYFLRYLDERNLKKESEDLLRTLIQNKEFSEHLFASPPEVIGFTLGYLVETGYGEIAQEMIDKYYNHLDLVSFEHLISHWHTSHLTALQGAIRKSGLNLAPELWMALIKKICGPSYREVVPDPEYPQHKLLCKSVEELSKLLKKIDETHNRYKLNCIVKSLISDMEKLKTWLNNLPPGGIILVRQTLDELNVRFPDEAWEIPALSKDNEYGNDRSIR